MMKILVYGAGIIGSIFAGMLARKGYDVTVLARGNRLHELNNNGLILVNSLNNKRMTVQVKKIDVLEAKFFTLNIKGIAIKHYETI